jgi:hypothetical protein
MSRHPLVVLVAVVMQLLPGGELWAHGMTLVLERRGDVVVAAVRYDGGRPVAGAAVVIRAPGDAEYQAGRTDAAGLFAFVPSQAGEWHVLVDDGLGHRRTARIGFEALPAARAGDDGGDVARGAAGHRNDAGGARAAPAAGIGGMAAGRTPSGPPAGGASSGPPAETMPWRLATGVSLLFGITGFGYGYAVRRRNGARAG